VVPSLLTAVAEISKIRSVKYRLSDGILGLSSYIGGVQTHEQENEMKRCLILFEHFVEYFETIKSYRESPTSEDQELRRKLELKMFQNPDIYAGLIAIFYDNREQMEQMEKTSNVLLEANGVTKKILSNSRPNKTKVNEAVRSLKILRDTVEKNTAERERTAEKMIYGGIPVIQ